LENFNRQGENMTEEMKFKLLEEEVASQRKLITLLVEFYDDTHSILNDHLNSVDEAHKEKHRRICRDKIEKDYDLNMFRPKKAEEEQNEI
jgi:phosphoenolpyruvate carboxylase